MTVQQWIEIAGIVLGGGGGARLVSKLTRLVMAVEQLAASHKRIDKIVAAHEARLNRAGL